MKLLYFIICSALLICCNTKEENQTIGFEGNNLTSPIEETPELPIKLEETFEYKLQNTEKFFLLFWYGMSKEEYRKATYKLASEGKYIVQNDYYLANDCKIRVTPNFENDSLESITLSENVECIYPYFVKKYNFPNFGKRDNTSQYYIENNPKYNPTLEYFDGKHTAYLPECFIDKSSFLKKSPQPLPIDNPFITQVNILPKDHYIIENNTGIVSIDQEIIYSDLPFYRYSLQDAPDMIRYKSSDIGKKHFNVLNPSESQMKFIESNSKTRTVLKTFSTKLKIKYTSKEKYEKSVSEENNSTQSRSDESIIDEI